MHEPADPHAGGGGGASSEPLPEDGQDRDEEAAGSGSIEVPLGLPVGEEEFRRLKREARGPGRDGAGDAPQQAQQDDAGDDRTQEGRS